MHITTRGTIDHPVGEVWVVLADFGNLMAWHPGVVACECEGTGSGSVRRVTLKDGRGATEMLEVVDEDRHLLVYRITKSVSPATIGMTSSITLAEADRGSTAVEWVVTSPETSGLTDEMVDGMREYYSTRVNDLADAVARRAHEA